MENIFDAKLQYITEKAMRFNNELNN
jgi:hypothetical protein